MKETRQPHYLTYQYVLLEIPCDMSCVSVIADTVPDVPHNNQLAEELNELIINKILNMINLYGTEHQKTIFHLRMQGLTQDEIAAKLNKSQTSIYNALAGNYSKARGAAYGGIRNKLYRHMLVDTYVIELSKQLYQTTDYAICLQLTQRIFKTVDLWEEWLNGIITFKFGKRDKLYCFQNGQPTEIKKVLKIY